MDCGFCFYYVMGLDESDQPCMICNNPSSFRYRDFVCINDSCSRFYAHPSIRSCENCVHSACGDRGFCFDCFGSVTNFSEFVPIASSSLVQPI